MPNGSAIFKMVLDKSFVYLYCNILRNEWPYSFECAYARRNFFDISSMCLLQLKFLSIYWPSDFAWSTLLIIFPSMFKFIQWLSVTASNFCLEPTIMNSVFATFKLHLFTLSHKFSAESSPCIVVWSSCEFLPGIVMEVSSAYIRGWEFFRQLGRSLM